MVATVGAFQGVDAVPKIMDLWYHPLMAARWITTIVKACRITPVPLEMVDSGVNGPRVRASGIAVWDLGFDGPAVPPVIHMPATAPLLSVPSSTKVVTLDLPAVDVVAAHQALRSPAFAAAVVRPQDEPGQQRQLQALLCGCTLS